MSIQRYRQRPALSLFILLGGLIGFVSFRVAIGCILTGGKVLFHFFSLLSFTGLLSFGEIVLPLEARFGIAPTVTEWRSWLIATPFTLTVGWFSLIPLVVVPLLYFLGECA